jgi:hypothetical protein
VSSPRSEALAAGETHYFTGQPCKQGHIAQRNAQTGKCLECRFPSAAKHREYNARWKAKYPGRDQEVKYRFRYGVELSEIRAKPETCELCGKAHKKIVFDHCHDTGEFRGWICDPCNIALGNVSDDILVLERMIAYLKGELAQ